MGVDCGDGVVARPKKKSNAGRPTVMTPIVIAKLEEAFSLGCSDREACFFADISCQALYNYQLKNPEFVERKENLKERPVLLARACVVKALQAGELEGNAALAKVGLDYLSKKKRDEFAERRETTGKDGEPQEVRHTMDLGPLKRAIESAGE